MVRKQILVAEDDPSIMEGMQMILEDAGYDVATSLNGDAVYNLGKQIPDLFLLDIWMSGVDGGDLCKYLKKDHKTQDCPVVLVSANRDGERIADESGADDFLAKPFEIEDLLAIVEKYIKQ